MKSKMRPIIVGLLYVVAIVFFIEAIMVNSGGGFFDDVLMYPRTVGSM